MAGPKHPRHYDEAFKRQIVQSCESGKPSREIRAEYDIARSTPRRWVQGIRSSGSTRAADNRTPERNEPIEPGKRNRQLEMKVDVSEQAAPVFARRQARYGPTPAAARYQRSAGSRALPSRPTTGCSDTPRPSASTLMRRTWSACSATAAGCTGPGGSSTPWGMRAWRSPGAASTGS